MTAKPYDERPFYPDDADKAACLYDGDLGTPFLDAIHEPSPK